ncbi:hypothetical protein METBIDRAFT_79533 [Metschnikowia bicuspidata var. bicuspidata NRRL YB-4993]|uniref:Uncharacterized protein n=1 Tax=Metschnikowia bicuspidata var. bicuspidata NRRL YB-4993 TaxID=869754 RepID=A0A1A0H6I4_9ASCO|nr:hypothetical protein METBIDRAFT_79533 [Metschnikowia bicuspidata var. bicuspidata NRRL YB-4993]OBA19517.1 hypothetical protein METBIDRAFT_79533 [Metschnikowia bicuspidata var. bicuspidata NRRL YB-4993]
MTVFRTDSKSQQPDQQPHHLGQNKLDASKMHDPILSAVNEAQPFEEANQVQFTRKQSYLSQGSDELRDPFGNKIRQADVLNPSRSRNERPLDTIRAFEYAITGDMTYRDQLESDRLGWGFHEDFPHHNLSTLASGSLQTGYSQPVASFSGANQQVYQATNYSALSLKPEPKKKKGLFGPRNIK